MKSVSLVSGGTIKTEETNLCTVVNEDFFTTVYCVKDTECKTGSSTGFVAVKSLNDMCSDDDEHMLRLENEYAISRHLALQCTSVRSALSLSEFDGSPAIFFEWAAGRTLSEWIRLLHKKKRLSPGIKIILKLACNISMALAEIHNAGVTHNNITPSKIIVDEVGDSDDILVKVIGLGSASLLTNGSEACSNIQRDLLSLGSVLFEMFTGRCPYKKDHGNGLLPVKKENQSKTFLSQNQLISMLTARAPLPLAKLVLNLMEVEGLTSCCHSAKDVHRELNEVLHNLDSIMSNSAQAALGSLLFPRGKLYGHDSHLLKIIDACSRIDTPGNSRITLVSGYSGVGKSSLVEKAKEKLKEKKIHFISGKYDQLQQARPLSAIDAALNEFTNKIIQQGPQTSLEVKEVIINAINSDVGVLTTAFPCLCKILGKPTCAPTEVGSIAAQNRFKFIFQVFIRAITTVSHPLILFLDDLQWVDELSLQLISVLVTDTETNNFLFIGSYRENEIGTSHPLISYLDELKKKRNHYYRHQYWLYF